MVIRESDENNGLDEIGTKIIVEMCSFWVEETIALNGKNERSVVAMLEKKKKKMNNNRDKFHEPIEDTGV